MQENYGLKDVEYFYEHRIECLMGVTELWSELNLINYQVAACTFGVSWLTNIVLEPIWEVSC